MISYVPNRDIEGNALYRNVIAKEGALFHPRVFDFTTGQYLSLCNKNSEGLDLGDGEILYLDSNRQFLTKSEEETDQEFQARLDSNCKFTWLYFTPTVDFGIKSFEISYSGTPSGEFDAWFELAPHIPKIYGGSVAAMDGGLPLEMFPEKSLVLIDGGACCLLEVDSVNFTHRMGVKIEHEIGDKLKIMSIFNVYY